MRTSSRRWRYVDAGARVEMACVERSREAPVPMAPLVVGDVEDCF